MKLSSWFHKCRQQLIESTELHQRGEERFVEEGDTGPPQKKIVKREKGHKTNKQTNKTGKRENQHVKREGRLSLKT